MGTQNASPYTYLTWYRFCSSKAIEKLINYNYEI